jgi:spoIIIJ-associated protein
MSSPSAEDLVAELLETIADALDLDADIEVARDGDRITGSLDGDDLGLFIGRRGQTIEAVQHLAQRIVSKDESLPKMTVVIDAAGYRARREEILHRQADEAAEDALRYGEAVSMDAMSASERKIVHTYLATRGDVETHSEGEEPDRYLVVEPLSK